MITANYLFQNKKPIIDMKKTGKNLKQHILNKGYSVHTVQERLHLSCPQPVYRWFQGKILPSIDHLFALSLLLNTPIDDLLIPVTQDAFCVSDSPCTSAEHLQMYHNYFQYK
ncbi:MAG: helix-turn-helix transcriptional regulator [Lachnospiraceae bacterium]|nr:helix-turn-helix transcriptional regulator [Lachnospiraceae bacterium]